MNQEPNEMELRNLFAGLRDREAAWAPSFQTLWNAARGRQGGAAPYRWRGLALAAALILAFFAYDLRRPARPPAGGLGDAGEVEVALGDWQAPSDALLVTPGSEWLAALPSLGLDQDLGLSMPESVSDQNPQTTKGTRG